MSSTLSRTATWIACACISAPLAAQVTSILSVGASGASADGASSHVALSADGRVTAFASWAALVPGDTNGLEDVYVRDRLDGTLVRASASTTGGPGGGSQPSLSADGTYVAFVSSSPSLVPGDSNGFPDVFVYDRAAATLERVSIASGGAQSNGSSSNPSISGDGRFVAFNSAATDLVHGDENGHVDVFVRDRGLSTTELASITWNGQQSDGDCFATAISADGFVVAFTSAAGDLVPLDANEVTDVFVRDRTFGTTELVSRSSAGEIGNARSDTPSLSADGRFVAFASQATNLDAQDPSVRWDVYQHDRVTHATELVSVGLGGGPGNDASEHPSISADGANVAFESKASNLVAADTLGQRDVFVRDMGIGLTELASVAPYGGFIAGDSAAPVLSGNARFVAMESDALLVQGDTTLVRDVFLRDLGTSSGAPFCIGSTPGADCPCDNTSIPGSGAGCASSLGNGGLLEASGAPSIAADSLVLTASGLTPSAPAIFFQGTERTFLGLGVAFGDGLRCTGGSVVRLGVHHALDGSAQFPSGSDQPISVQGALAQGDTRNYQVWYRNAAAFCTSATFNLTNGWEVRWLP